MRMTRYEYRYLDLQGKFPIALLNELGHEGWKVVTAHLTPGGVPGRTGPDHWDILLMRKKIEKA